ncbi:MAG: AAA family ATPase [Armatimonadetes bacterium]|nr:AAA family ATPase [Armatimonadota bacterium]PIU67343.1 MAG: ATPase [Armatimonadetes bacterium CG07_land_8_20_14_0_80_59_28]PIX44739.1 MAG: ATPase [Armatimonadetes bacterium CG_4_8_14_3_um_filter_58_9]PIY42188.1 MAG: ATPase [Armatimonadetes bacterium CG_4_10_14_3_um_filter_59_10]
MLTRLKVSGFKNLVDVDVRLGPFTCVAGANGTGKSNLFDAIKFLSALADHTLIDAATQVRGEGGRASDIRSLFHRNGDQYADRMSFEAEMIVPYEGVDDLGQQAHASITFLRYSITMGYRSYEDLRAGSSLEILSEDLVHINQSDAHKHLLFPHQKAWRSAAVRGVRRTAPFISTQTDGSLRIIELHQDQQHGRPRRHSAADLPRTVLSASNAAESPTVLMARREMQSWRLLQLEPSAMRRPDDFKSPTRLGPEGAHLAATLYHLAHVNGDRGNADSRVRGRSTAPVDEAQVYAQAANRLAELIDDVREVTVDEDQKRELLTLIVTDRNSTPHPARVLSDGTLRFLALAVTELDPRAQGLLCLEEPENGIHPERIPAMLRLLQDIATAPNEPVGPDNPLRQVMVNTHSPAVVGLVPDDCLLVSELIETVQREQRFKRACFSSLPDTWRARVPDDPRMVPVGKLLSYLNPIAPVEDESAREETTPSGGSPKRPSRRARRVVERPDLQPPLFSLSDTL